MGSNTEKKPWTILQNLCKNLRKEIKSDNFSYRKIGREITNCGVIEKSPKLPFLKGTNLTSFLKLLLFILAFWYLFFASFIDGSHNN